MPSIQRALGFACLCGVAVVASGADVLTNHNNNARTGLVSDEKILTPSNAAQLKVLYQSTVDGQIYAQPLCVSNQLVKIGGASQGKHDLVIVATENGSVYAFDAATGVTYWQVSLLSSGYTAVQYSDPAINCADIEPEISITATPVIDRNAGPNGRIFVVAMETDGKEDFDYKLHALDLATGKDAITPAVITASVTGQGPATTFIAQKQRSRSALLLLNGVVYFAFASFCDNPPYSGWLLGYRESDLTQVMVFNDDPNGSPPTPNLSDGSGGGIWMSGLGPASDAKGNIYLSTGNGPFDQTLTASGFPANQDYGDSVLKLTPSTGVPQSLTVTDYFTPYIEALEAFYDADLGSGGVVILPAIRDTRGKEHHLMVLGGKDANVYLLERKNLGKFNATQNNNYQDLVDAMPFGVFSAAAWFNGSVYFGANGMPIERFVFDFSNPDKPLLNQIPAAQGTQALGYPGCTPSISSNGKQNAIVWAYEYSSSNAILHAFDALTLTELYNSSAVSIGPGVKFAVPTVFAGKVYVGTSNALVAFGL
jgi:outer membrane protein assembly factor BamB